MRFQVVFSHEKTPNTKTSSTVFIPADRWGSATLKQRAKKITDKTRQKATQIHMMDKSTSGQGKRLVQHRRKHHTTVNMHYSAVFRPPPRRQAAKPNVTQCTTNTTHVFETVTSATCTAKRTHAQGKEHTATPAIHLLMSAECGTASTSTRRSTQL